LKILIVYPYVPYPLNRGSYHRVFNLARELGRRHRIDLFCLDDSGSEPHRKVFEEFAGRVQFHPFHHPPWPRLFPERLLNPVPTTVEHWHQPEVASSLEKFTAGQTYDLVHFCDLVMWQYVAPLPGTALRVMDRSRVDLLFQTEELQNLRLGLKEKWLRRENLLKLRRYERQTAAQLSATVVCGPDDETFLRREVPEAARIKVLANGVDEQFFRREDFPPQPDPEPTILFCGAMDYSPNVNGLAWYFERCDAEVRRRVPNRRVLIVGKNPAPQVRDLASIEGVTVTGEVADVRPFYQRAWLQMVPLLIGGGSRLKIVESLALGTPVVSTTIGAQGLALENEAHLLLADSPPEFAAAVARMLGDAPLRGRLAESGREHILQHYTWGMLGEELSQYYEELRHADDRKG
jgi:glycosyltransferase involved in cell wall biosynthesis